MAHFVVTLYDIEVKYTFTHHDSGSLEHSSTGNTICIVIGVFDGSTLNLVSNYMFVGTPLYDPEGDNASFVATTLEMIGGVTQSLTLPVDIFKPKDLCGGTYSQSIFVEERETSFG